MHWCLNKSRLLLIGIVGLAGLGAAVSGCASERVNRTMSSDEQGQESVLVTGSFGYRERIMPPPKSRARIVLADVSRADAKAVVLDEQSYELNGKAPPYEYALSAPASKIESGHRYAVRAEIRGHDGSLLWTTDRSMQIDNQLLEQELGPIWLVRVPRR